MSGYLWLLQPSSVPPPADLSGYLLQRGWKLESANAHWATYSSEIAGEHVGLEVPQQAAARDYPRALAALIDDLARLEARTASAVLRDIKAASTDIVRLGIEGSSTRDGRVPVEAGRRIYQAGRDLLLAAACSVIDPRLVFAKRKPEEAMNLLSRARFGQTEVGSFVLTIECGVPPRLQPSLLDDDGDPDAPLERKTCVQLARAMQAAEEASRESAASGQIEPFLHRTKVGVSTNLCDAIAEIMDAAGAETLRAGFSFAARRPLAAEAPRAVVFSSDTAPILREAATRLREEATYPATEILGTVVKLDSPDAAAGGEAVLRIDLDGRVRPVRLALEARDYQAAISAHSSRALVRCTGDLAREGRSWVLRNAHDFGAVSEFDE